MNIFEVKKCCILGCDEDAIYIDDMDDYYCEDCFEQNMDEENKSPEDYEGLNLIK